MGIEITPKHTKGNIISSAEWNVFIDNFAWLKNLLDFLKDHIELGKVENIPTNKAGVKTGDITFSKTFSSPPLVFLNLENINPHVNIVNLNSTDVTVNGFTWSIKITVEKPHTFCNLNWLAML